MRLLPALRWSGLAGLVFLGASQIRSVENSTPGFRLLYRLPLSQVELPSEWFSMRDLQLQGDPYWDPEGSYVLPTEKVDDDLLVASLGDLSTSFLAYPMAGADEDLVLPKGGALLVRWEHGSGMIEVLNSAWVFRGDPDNAARLMGRESIHAVDPVSGTRPKRSERPPSLKRWVPATMTTGGDLPWAETVQAGSGYLEIYGDGGMLFAAAGQLESGPSDLEGWLNVAIDHYGDLYFWFDQQ
ncbi:MAG: hypothetical protein H8E31_13135 [Planctomycetes bacterium]|nr:hypothetical protein [Planctomycetota bacterium]